LDKKRTVSFKGSLDCRAQPHYSGEVETNIILLCGKYIRDNMYKILSESASFCRRCVTKHFGVFLVHSINCRSVTKRER